MKKTFKKIIIILLIIILSISSYSSANQSSIFKPVKHIPTAKEDVRAWVRLDIDPDIHNDYYTAEIIAPYYWKNPNKPLLVKCYRFFDITADLNHRFVLKLWTKFWDTCEHVMFKETIYYEVYKYVNEYGELIDKQVSYSDNNTEEWYAGCYNESFDLYAMQLKLGVEYDIYKLNETTFEWEYENNKTLYVVCYTDIYVQKTKSNFIHFLESFPILNKILNQKINLLKEKKKI